MQASSSRGQVAGRRDCRLRPRLLLLGGGRFRRSCHGPWPRRQQVKRLGLRRLGLTRRRLGLRRLGLRRLGQRRLGLRRLGLRRHLDPCHPYIDSIIECRTFGIERNIRYRRATKTSTSNAHPIIPGPISTFCTFEIVCRYRRCSISKVSLCDIEGHKPLISKVMTHE
jgi:hypothetical protein